MSEAVSVDVFVEDRAHEAFLIPLVNRIAEQEGITVTVRVRSARGGHARAVEELRLYERLVLKGGVAAAAPDLLVVGIDGNCSSFAAKRAEIAAAVEAPFSDRLVVAAPDPHIERWYLADPQVFQAVVGQHPGLGEPKCIRDHYKQLLSEAIRKAGHPPTLGGIEFAAELVAQMDLYRAGKNDRSLKAFVDDLRGRLKTFSPGRSGDA
jgi:hypothetical protein